MIMDVYKLPIDEPTFIIPFIVTFIMLGAAAENKDI